MVTTCEFSEAVPDLLRRFVATPHRAILVLGSHFAEIETNNQELLRWIPAQAINGDGDSPQVRVKVIVDPELQLADNSAAMILDTGAVLWGRSPEMLFAADCQAQTVQVFMTKPETGALRDFVRNVLCELLLPPSPPR